MEERNYDLKEYKNKKKNPLDPILFFLDIFGNLPLSRNEKGDLYFKVISFSVVRSVLTTAAKVCLAVRITLWKTSHSKYWESYDATLSSINDLLLLLTCFHPLLSTWKATPDIARAVHQWGNFAGNLKKQTNHFLSSRILTYSNIGVTFIVVYTSFVGVHYLILHRNKHFHGFRLAKFILTCLCLFYYFLIVLLWIVLCLMTKNPAGILQEKLNQTLNMTPDPETINSISNIRLLWVEMLACTRGLVGAFGSTIQLWILTNVLLNLLSTYGMLIYLLVDSSVDVNYAPQALVSTLLTTLVVFNVGHLTEKSITDYTLKSIFFHRWDKLPKVLRNEMELFVDTVEAGRETYLIKGLFTINRIAFISLFQTGLTYLVVLMQLKVSTSKS